MDLNNITSAEIDQLNRLVCKQVGFFNTDDVDPRRFQASVEEALQRIRVCFSRLKNKYYQRDGVPMFSPKHTGQYAIFLYYLSRMLRVSADDVDAASDVYALNKMLHNVDMFYEVELPDVFYLDHPLGTVIGRGTFSECFQFRQNCTVGNNHGIFPVFGKNVQMWSGVTVVGKCQIGDHVTLAQGTYVKDQDIPSYSLVFGRSPDLIIKARDPEKAKQSNYFIIEES